MSVRTFNWQSEIPLPVEDLFAWHMRPGAFARLNPPWRPIRIITQNPEVTPGSEVLVRLPVLGPIGINWLARHTTVTPPTEFRDTQVYGPFAQWNHTHRFIPESSTHTVMRDEITYKLPIYARPLTKLFVREFERLFRFRHEVLRTDIKLHSRWSDQPRKRVLISGSSGFVGNALAAFLSTAGHEVTRLVRRTPHHSRERFWNPETGELDPDVFDNIDILVHLGGENITATRWSPAQKKAIRDSRIKSTNLLASAIARRAEPIELAIFASAIGFYGDTGATAADETSPKGSGFLAEVCQDWESAAQPAHDTKCRVVHTRIGTVLNAAGGALKKMLPAFLSGAGGMLGSGEQFMSWIALQDFLGAIEHIIYTPSLSGIVNLTSPNPVTNREFTRALGEALRRPTWCHVPAFALRAIFGELAESVLLSSTNVRPAKLVGSGYVFEFPELPRALRFECGLSPSV